MKVKVIKAYQRPYEDPIAANADETVDPDFEKPTDIDGWVWCRARDGRSGWTPKAWLVRSGERWVLTRDFNAIELTVSPGENLEVEFEESRFYWVVNEDGQAGWVPCDCVSLA